MGHSIIENTGALRSLNFSLALLIQWPSSIVARGRDCFGGVITRRAGPAHLAMYEWTRYYICIFVTFSA